MPKPYGLSITGNAHGELTYRTTTPSNAENAIWDAVEEAIKAGMSVKRFLNEAEYAWGETMLKMAADAAKEWPK